MKQRLLIPVLMVLVIGMVACAPTPELRNADFFNDESLLSDEPCATPCWNGITPGETSWRDALIIIEDDARFKDLDVIESEDDASRAVGWKAESDLLCCQMTALDGEIVDSVFLLLAPTIGLGELVEKYGEPSYVTGNEVSDGQALLLVIYPETSLILYVFVEGAEGALSADSEIVGVVYTTPENMDSIIEETNLYNWSGFQTFAEIIDGEFDITAVPATENEDSE